MGGKVIARGIGLGVLAMGASVAIIAAWVWFYSVAIDPGHDGVSYQRYGQRVAPMIGIAAGIPLLLAAGWLSGRATRHPLAPILPALAFIVLDLMFNALGNLWPPAWSLIVSYLTKLASAWAGGAIAQRPPAA